MPLRVDGLRTVKAFGIAKVFGQRRLRCLSRPCTGGCGSGGIGYTCPFLVLGGGMLSVIARRVNGNVACGVTNMLFMKNLAGGKGYGNISGIG